MTTTLLWIASVFVSFVLGGFTVAIFATRKSQLRVECAYNVGFADGRLGLQHPMRKGRRGGI